MYAVSCSLSMPTQAVIQPQGFLASEKKSAFQKLVNSDPVMKSCASAFIVQNKSQEDISELGKELTVDLFGGKPKDTLSSLCHINFTNRVTSAKTYVIPERLPPTFPATTFQSLRVYYQIMVWMGMANDPNPRAGRRKAVS